MTGRNITKLQPVPLRPVIDGEAKEVPQQSERERALDAYVDRLMQRSPALDREQIRSIVEADLRELARNGLKRAYPLKYKWSVVNGRFQVDWPDDQ
jgi:hypothetical protein